MQLAKRAAAALLPVALAGALLAGCTGGTPDKTAHTHPIAPKPTASKAVPTPAKAAKAATERVPADLVGKTMGAAKAKLSKAGFTRILVAGGDGITDSAEVAGVSHAGESVAPDTRIVLTGAAPKPERAETQRAQTERTAPAPPAHSRAACLRDATQCYLEGRQCETGSCVNAARGLSQQDVKHRTEDWIDAHPGYCAAGVTGAVAPCGPDGN